MSVPTAGKYKPPSPPMLACTPAWPHPCYPALHRPAVAHPGCPPADLELEDLRKELSQARSEFHTQDRKLKSLKVCPLSMRGMQPGVPSFLSTSVACFSRRFYKGAVQL